jgi:peptide/nickel transport system substrate-binding protein
MEPQELKSIIGQVKSGRMSRRAFINRMLAVGLTVPLATQLLAMGGVAMAQSASPYKPTKAGGGGTLKLLWWQGPTLLNPHFAVGTKDQDGSRLFYEPLAAWNSTGDLVPILAAELPSTENGGLAADGKSVIWKLKQGVKWHDGQPFTADDVVFNWSYAKDPATAAVTAGSYNNITVQKIDDYTVKVLFPKPSPFWADAFVSSNGMIIPKHLFEDFSGSKSRDAPTNLKPVGTGPYLFKDFRPGDLVSGVINPNYHQPNRPYFDAVEMKGGGDAASAARAVLQTGEYDFAWNLQVAERGRFVSPKAAASSISSSTTPIPTSRSTASDPASKASIRPCPIPRSARRCRCWSTRTPCTNTSTAAAVRRPLTSSSTRSASPRRTPTMNSTSTRRSPSSTRPAGCPARTAPAPRTARR